MRKFMQAVAVLESRDVPDTQYGYWISAEGEIIPVDFEAHGRVAAQHDLHGNAAAYRTGWIRVVCVPNRDECSISFCSNRTANKALLGLRRLLRANERIRFFADEYRDQYGVSSPVWECSKTFNQPQRLLIWMAETCRDSETPDGNLSVG